MNYDQSELMILNEDGSTTGVADDVDIHAYADEFGGKVIRRDQYVYVPTLNELSATEVSWREEQMPRAQQNVTAIEYGEEGIPGTAQQWQKYWLALRKWTETNPDFPDSSKRPVAPS